MANGLACYFTEGPCFEPLKDFQYILIRTYIEFQYSYIIVWYVGDHEMVFGSVVRKTNIKVNKTHIIIWSSST